MIPIDTSYNDITTARITIKAEARHATRHTPSVMFDINIVFAAM
jgi:hypothetical protein